MSWIKMRANLDSDPDVIAMASKLDLDELNIIGRLWKLWSWADSHSTDGNAMRVTEVTLDRFAQCQGFAVAMRDVGWLAGRDGALSFPRFDRHNGQTSKTRAVTQSRVAAHRNARVTLDALPEKRRGDNKQTNTAHVRDVEEAIQYGASHHPPWKESMVRAWYANRDSQKWEKTSGLPITNWRSDLDSWGLRDAHGEKGPRSRNGTGRTMSVFEIEKRIEAINGQINKLHRDDREKNKPRIEQLKLNRESLKDLMVAAPEGTR